MEVSEMQRIILIALILISTWSTSFATEEWIKDPDGLKNYKWGTDGKIIKISPDGFQLSLDRKGNVYNYGVWDQYLPKEDINFSKIYIGSSVFKVKLIFFDKDMKLYKFSLDNEQKWKSIDDTYRDLVQLYGDSATPLPPKAERAHFRFVSWILPQSKVSLYWNGSIEFASNISIDFPVFKYSNANKVLSIESNGTYVEITNNRPLKISSI